MHMKHKKFTALCLCAVLLSSVALTACKKQESTIATADEAPVTVTTQVTQQTEPLTTSTVAQNEVQTTCTTPPATKSSKPAAQNNSNNTSQNTGHNSSSNSGSNSGSAQSKPVTCIITVDGKDHKVLLGDTLTYTYYIKTPKKIENVQATVNYSGTTLKLLDNVLVTDLEEVADSSTLDKELAKVFPILKSSAIYNAFNHNIIKFNASNISGFDFTKGDYLIKLRFEVISGINGAVSTKVEFMDEVGGNPYVDNFKFSDDVEQKESLTQ